MRCMVYRLYKLRSKHLSPGLFFRNIETSRNAVDLDIGLDINLLFNVSLIRKLLWSLIKMVQRFKFVDKQKSFRCMSQGTGRIFTTVL